MITIERKGLFVTDNYVIITYGELQCDCCGDYLLKEYCYIINELKKNNLLPDDFKMLCCTCNIINYTIKFVKKERNCGYTIRFNEINGKFFSPYEYPSKFKKIYSILNLKAEKWLHDHGKEKL